MSTRRALAFSFIDRYAGLVIHTASSMVIARLLTPAEIGVYAVVMVLLGFVATFRDLGAGQYLVSHPALTPDVMRVTFTVQLALGLALAAIVALAAVPIAAFYREPRMIGICYVLSLNFLVTPWLAYPNCWLAREMRFGTLAIVRFVGAITHASTAIGLVMADFGPISLAWANLLTTIAGIVVIHWVGRPKLPRRPTSKGLREVLSFGGQLTVISLLDTLRTGIAELVIGRVQGLAAAGYLSRGQGLVAMFEQLVLSAVNQVALPFFARQVREGRSLGEPFLAAIALVTGLGWSFFACLLLLAYPVVRLLYGTQWDAAVEPVRWLALAAALALPGLVCSAPMLAAGQVGKALRASASAAVLTVAAVLVGSSIGLVGTTQLLCLSGAASTLIWLHLSRRHMGCGRREIAVALLPSLAVAAAAALGPALVVLAMGWRPAAYFTALLFAVPSAVAGGLAGAFMVRHRLWQEIERVVLPRLRRSA